MNVVKGDGTEAADEFPSKSIGVATDEEENYHGCATMTLAHGSNDHLLDSVPAQKCCLRECELQWSWKEGEKLRRYVQELGKEARKELLQKYLRQDETGHRHCYLPKDLKDVDSSCTPNVIPVCTKAWKHVFGVSSRQLYQYQNPRVKRCRAPDKFLQAKQWLIEQKQIYEISPVACHVYVPYETRDIFFKIFQETHPDISKTTFESAWHSDECHMIKVRRWNPFPKCDTCCFLREELRKLRGDKEKTKEMLEKVKAHESFFRAEKHAYHERRLLAIKDNNNYMSIIIDGADQALYDIPHMAVRCKFIVSRLRIPLKIMGAIVHGERSYGFGYSDNMKHGTNTVIQALHECLLDQFLIHGKLPKHLLLQLDNTSAQNKNRYMVGYCALLVQHGLFHTVRISYLPVGHTHEDIDQLFSTFHKKLNQMNVLSRLDMATAFTEGFRRLGEMVQTFTSWDSVVNMSDFLKPEIPSLGGIMGYRQILIKQLDAQSCTVVAQFKKYAIGSDDEFRGLDESTTHTVILEDWVHVDPMPDCQRKFCEQSDIIVRHKEVWEIIHRYGIGPPHVRDLKQCLQLLEGGTVLPCPWTGTDYKFYDKSWREHVPAMVHPPIRLKDPGVRVGHLYILRPDQSVDNPDPQEFWLAKVVGFVPEKEDKVKTIVQWYEAPTEFDEYRPTQRRSVLHSECLRLRVHLTSAGRLRSSDVEAIHGHLLNWRNTKMVESDAQRIAALGCIRDPDPASDGYQYDDDDEVFQAAKAERKARIEEAKRKRKEERERKASEKHTRKRRIKTK